MKLKNRLLLVFCKVCCCLITLECSLSSCDQLPEGISTSGFPTFYSQYLDERICDIKNAIAETDGNYETFFWITDIHWEPDLNTRHAPAMIKYIASKTGIDKILNGGDSGNGQVICKNAIDRLRDAIGSDNVYTVNGNHEMVDASKYEKPFKRVDSTLRGHNCDLVYGDADRSYFYFDDVKNKTRYIGLSVFGVYRNGTCEPSLNTVQLDWFRNIALFVDEGWKIIVFAHSLYGIDEANDNLVISLIGAVEFIQTIDSYRGSGEIVCVLLGHSHRDRMHISDTGVPYIISACDRHATYNGDINVLRTLGTLSEQHFEVVVVDKTRKNVRLFSIGAFARDGIDNVPGDLVDERVVTYGKP